MHTCPCCLGPRWASSCTSAFQASVFLRHLSFTSVRVPCFFISISNIAERSFFFSSVSCGSCWKRDPKNAFEKEFCFCVLVQPTSNKSICTRNCSKPYSSHRGRNLALLKCLAQVFRNDRLKDRKSRRLHEGQVPETRDLGVAVLWPARSWTWYLQSRCWATWSINRQGCHQQSRNERQNKMDWPGEGAKRLRSDGYDRWSVSRRSHQPIVGYTAWNSRPMGI